MEMNIKESPRQSAYELSYRGLRNEIALFDRDLDWNFTSLINRAEPHRAHKVAQEAIFDLSAIYLQRRGQRLR